MINAVVATGASLAVVGMAAVAMADAIDAGQIAIAVVFVLGAVFSYLDRVAERKRREKKEDEAQERLVETAKVLAAETQHRLSETAKTLVVETQEIAKKLAGRTLEAAQEVAQNLEKNAAAQNKLAEKFVTEEAAQGRQAQIVKRQAEIVSVLAEQTKTADKTQALVNGQRGEMLRALAVALRVIATDRPSSETEAAAIAAEKAAHDHDVRESEADHKEAKADELEAVKLTSDPETPH